MVTESALNFTDVFKRRVWGRGFCNFHLLDVVWRNPAEDDADLGEVILPRVVVRQVLGQVPERLVQEGVSGLWRGAIKLSVHMMHMCVVISQVIVEQMC